MLAVVVVASLGGNSTHAVQKHDPQFQKVYVHSLTPEPNLVRLVRYQNGSPRRKPDLYVAPFAPGKDRDVLREILNQNGSPKWKSDRVLNQHTR
jgi:hypothetical protein